MSLQISDIGAIATFAVLTVFALTLSELGPRAVAPAGSNVGLLLVAVTSVLVGRPFVPELADAGPSTDENRQAMFGRLHAQVQWLWVATFAGMTVSSSRYRQLRVSSSS